MLPWDFAGHCRTTERTVTVPNTPFVQLCPADPARIGLIIGASQPAARITLTTDENAVPNLNGFYTGGLPPAPFVLTFIAHGVLTQLAWFGASDTDGAPVCVIEVFLNSDPCAAGSAAPG